MKLSITLNLDRCYQCPFVEKIYEHGFSGNCCKFIPYGEIAKDGFRKDCPFINNKPIDKITYTCYN